MCTERPGDHPGRKPSALSSTFKFLLQRQSNGKTKSMHMHLYEVFQSPEAFRFRQRFPTAFEIIDSPAFQVRGWAVVRKRASDEEFPDVPNALGQNALFPHAADARRIRMSEYQASNLLHGRHIGQSANAGRLPPPRCEISSEPYANSSTSAASASSSTRSCNFSERRVW